MLKLDSVPYSSLATQLGGIQMERRWNWLSLWHDVVYWLTAIGLKTGGSSTVHIYTQTIHRTKQNKQYIEQHKIWEECGPCPVFASYTLAFALQLREKHGKTSVRVAEDWQLARWKQNIQNTTYIAVRIIHNNNYGCSFFPLFFSKCTVCNCAGPTTLLHSITCW
jgi:hypothetical protein